MSVIQLFVKDKMAVVAHLVGKDTLSSYLEGLGIDDDVRKELFIALIRF